MASGSGSGSKEFVVRAPKDSNMTFGIVKFNPSNKVDFTKAESVRIERENNLKDFKAAYGMDSMPKFGAGSEFGREEREEARRKKYGIHRKRYNVDDQPWLLKLGPGKTARRFKGTKEGGILENASYYVFTQCSDGAFDAYPVKDWHSFNPIIKYKHLNIDEAEEQFTRRDKTMNYFNIMVKKRMQGPDAEEKNKDDKEKKEDKKKKKKGKDFLLTDMDDWANFSEDDDNDDSDEEQRKSDSDDSASGSKKKGKDKTKKKIKKDHKTNSGDEAVEESDEEDEGREVDYMTDTDSDDEEMYAEKGRNTLDKYKQTGVEDEEGLTAVIESEEEEEAQKEDGSENEASDNEGKTSQRSSDSSSDSESDPEKDNSFVSPLFMQKKDTSTEQKERKEKDKKKSKKDKKSKDKKGKKRRNSESSEASNVTSRSATPTSLLAQVDKKDSQVAKRAKMETPPISGCEGLTEDMVRRYLMRKPMTTGELLLKFKNVGLTKDRLVTTITEILKRLNPEKKTIDGKLQLWIKKTE